MDEESALDALEAFQVSEKRIAMQTLANLGKVEEYSDQISKLLDDEDAPVRKEAALTLGKANPCKSNRTAESLVRTLAHSLTDSDKSVRAEVARAIGTFGKQGTLVADKVASALGKDTEDEVGVAAVECLTLLGETVRLGPFLKSSNPNICRVAVVETARSPEARVKLAQSIQELLSHPDTTVRLAAVQASGELGHLCSESHFSALANLVSDRQMKVRRAGVQAVGKAGVTGIPYLVNFFHDNDESVRHFAAETLGGIACENAAAAAADLLVHPDGPVRRAALLALGKMKVDGRDRATDVAEHLHDEDFAARLAAIQALSDLGAATEARLVGELSTDANLGIRQAAVNALAKMGTEGAVQALHFLDDADPAVRQAAVKVYSPLHSKLPADLALPHADSVCRKMGDQDWRVRFAAVVALGDLKTRQYANQVAVLCNDDNNQVRRSAILSLVKIGGTAAHVAAFLQDEDAGVKKEAELAHANLSANGPDDGEISECD